MNDEFHEIFKKLMDSKDYIKITELKDGYSYKIFARNAYVGVWNKSKNGFLISRYKVGSKPYLFYEYHWDWDDTIGTAKPLEEIEKCPFSDLSENRNNLILINYLDELEQNNPILPGYDSLKERKENAIRFEKHLSGEFKVKGIPRIHELIKSGVIKES